MMRKEDGVKLLSMFMTHQGLRTHRRERVHDEEG